MKKKLVIILSVLVIFGFGIYVGKGTTQLKNITKIPTSSSSMIAMYIQDEEGNYNLSDAREFPKDGYMLNTEKSSCKNGGKITQNASTKALSLKVKTSDECTVYFDIVKSTVKVGEGAKTLLAKMNDSSITDYNSGNKEEMFVFDHPEAEQTTGWTEEERRDYRYIGKQPNNYITFNNETWRIIGVFTVENENEEKEQLIKIIREEILDSDVAWTTTTSNPSEWQTATLQKTLNDDYYNRTGKYNSKGLNILARSQVAKIKWYLGASSDFNRNSGGAEYYAFERGTETCVTKETCEGETRTTSIIQNIGLMYPSDYSYTYANGVDNKCYTQTGLCGSNYSNTSPGAGWLYIGNYYIQWTITPTTSCDSMDGCWINYVSYWIGSTTSWSTSVSNSTVVRPAIYLKSSVKITGGDGSESNPYTLSE